MREEKLVSVIIPVYNVESYLRRAIDSVLSQTYTNLEIILVNDGSTDDSLEICKQYKLLDHRIIVIDKENGGLSDARNAGIKVATGTYFYFMDSDDYVEPDLISTCTDYMDKDEKLDLVSFNYIAQKPDGTIVEGLKFAPCIMDVSTEEKKFDYLYRYFLPYAHGVEVWARMFRGDIIRKYNLKFTDNKRIFAEDICFFMHYITFCKYIRVIENKFYHYIKRDDSIQMANKEKVKFNQFTELCYVIDEFYKEQRLEYLSNHSCFILSKMFLGEFGVLWRNKQTKELSKYIDTICNKSYFEDKISDAYKRRKELRELEGNLSEKLTHNGLRYALGGSYIVYRLHRVLIRLEMKFAN